MPAAQATRYLTVFGPSMLHGHVAYLQLAKPSILEYLRCIASDRRVTHVSQ